MGCASSKRVEAANDVYRPAPGSFTIFDINSIEEPWFQQQQQQQKSEKPVEAPCSPHKVMEKLHAFELITDAPKPWAEVSKALEDLKPTLVHSPVVLTLPTKPETAPLHPPSPWPNSPTAPKSQRLKRKSFSFHTLEEIESRLSPNSAESKKTGRDKTEPKQHELYSNPAEFKRVGSLDSIRSESQKINSAGPPVDAGVIRPIRENMFVVKDRLGKEKDQEKKGRWDPLNDFPEKCPPDGGEKVVFYTTSLGGIRRTYEDCERVRAILELHGVVFDERDVSLHAEFRTELRAILGEERVSIPRVFLKGRYLGGVEELVGLNESGRLRRLLSRTRVERGKQACEGCGGKRFVPCLECGGSCRVVVKENEKERCSKCNENGLVLCPSCH